MGISIKVIRVDTKRPPITVIPKGRQISDPKPELKAMGIMPKIVVKDVINTGLNLDFPALINDSLNFCPLALRRFV